MKALDSKFAAELIVGQQRSKRIIHYYDEQPTILKGEQHTNEDGFISVTFRYSSRNGSPC